MTRGLKADEKNPDLKISAFHGVYGSLGTNKTIAFSYAATLVECERKKIQPQKGI